MEMSYIIPLTDLRKLTLLIPYRFPAYIEQRQGFYETGGIQNTTYLIFIFNLILKAVDPSNFN